MTDVPGSAQLWPVNALKRDTEVRWRSHSFRFRPRTKTAFAALSPSESADSAEFFACYSPLLVPCSVARCPACIRLSSPARAVSRISPRQSNPCRTHGSLPIVRAAARDADICRLTFPGTTFPGLLDEARANLRSAVGN